jgi:hypothetical protein
MLLLQHQTTMLLAVDPQLSLTDVYNGLITLSTASKRVLGSDDDHAALPALIAKEITAMAGLADLLLDGPFSTCISHITRTILHIHTEDLLNSSGGDGCSMYAVDVAAQLSMFAEGVIPALARSRSLGQRTLRLARSVLDFFVRHVTLVFPLDDAVRDRIATDMARIEQAVETLCPLRLLGDSYRAIRALRLVLFMSNEELASASASPDALDTLSCIAPSAVALHILSRCCDEDLSHPHRRQDMSPAAYSDWLDMHSEEDVWGSVQDSVKSYEAKRDTSVPPCAPYTAIVSLAEPLQTMWTAAHRDEEW